MSDETANLALPYILPSQAQKHVTHNEALQRLDAAVQLVIADERAVPPDTAIEGACYLIAADAGGVWAGKSAQIALRQDGDWIYLSPKPGWRAWFEDAGRLRVRTGSGWTDIGLPSEARMQTLGINATADDTNRLAVAAPATLFTHDGHGHQIKINKAAAVDTASLLFQTAWSGRAEMGMAGSDSFAIKLSSDGNSWQTGLSISPDGVVTAPGRPVARAFLVSAALTPTAGSQTGFSTLATAQGGVALGPAIGGVAGNRLIVPAAGLYLIALATSTITSSGHTVSLVANGATVLAATGSPATTGTLHQSAAAIVALESGDALSLLHAGTAQFEFGIGKTEIHLMRI